MLDHGPSRGKTRLRWNILIGMIVLGLLLAACSSPRPPDPLTIGIVNHVESLTPAFDGFKAGMAALGYVEGEDVVYIYDGVIEPEYHALEREVEYLLAQDVEMLFTLGNLPTLVAKQVAAGTNIPIVFSPIMNPVEEGVVESLRCPGSNLTGVTNGTGTAKALEWLVTITPQADKVYLPYNPDDSVSLLVLSMLDEVPPQLDIEIVLGEVQSVEEAVAAIESLPEDIDAIFRIPSPTLDPRNRELSQAAIRRGVPIGGNLIMDEAVLITYAADDFEMGKQAARLADQIHRGVKPADLPVETAEFYITINLKTAEMIGLDIPDEILEQADIILR
ncbi:MAG: ABC transporter substrate-binding protein [Anaerolineae bacterium]|nr:ABC transporter substrate-binding protein [Anaerolineae bacterium]